MDFNINENNIDGSNFVLKVWISLMKKCMIIKIQKNEDILLKIFDVLSQIKKLYFLKENVILDREIPKSDDFKDF